MEKSYKNLGYVLLLFIPLTLLAFYQTYFGQFPTFEENITPYIHLHALVASIWILMLIVQPLLIRYRKNAWHRRIGKASYLIFPLLILSFIPQMIRIYHSDNQIVLFFPLADCLALVLFYGLAISFRKTPAKHMRYMIGTAIVFLGPTMGRIGPIVLGIPETITQNVMYGIIYIILLSMILLDRRAGRMFQPYLVILSVWIIHQISFNILF